MKVITWLDLQGRYRVTSPAYADLLRLKGFNEDDAINWVWTNIVQSGKYGITYNHPFFLVEDLDQRARLKECCGTYFRYGAIMRPNREGFLDGDGIVKFARDARDGAWEMDVDGRPKVNMPKARGVQMDYIRQARDAGLAKLDVPFMRALEAADVGEQQRLSSQKQALRDIPETFDLEVYSTPESLKEAWPTILPSRL